MWAQNLTHIYLPYKLTLTELIELSKGPSKLIRERKINDACTH